MFLAVLQNGIQPQPCMDMMFVSIVLFLFLCCLQTIYRKTLKTQALTTTLRLQRRLFTLYIQLVNSFLYINHIPKPYHSCLASVLWDIGNILAQEQTPRTASHPGLYCVLTVIPIKMIEYEMKMKKNAPDTPKHETGVIQMIRLEKSILKILCKYTHFEWLMIFILKWTRALTQLRSIGTQNFLELERSSMLILYLISMIKIILLSVLYCNTMCF